MIERYLRTFIIKILFFIFTEYLLNNSYETFCKDLYFAYDCLNTYIPKINHITKNDYADYPSEYYPGIPYEDCILSKNMIDEFISYVSSVDIYEYIKKIRKSKKNVKP